MKSFRSMSKGGLGAISRTYHGSFGLELSGFKGSSMSKRKTRKMWRTHQNGFPKKKSVPEITQKSENLVSLTMQNFISSTAKNIELRENKVQEITLSNKVFFRNLGKLKKAKLVSMKRNRNMMQIRKFMEERDKERDEKVSGIESSIKNFEESSDLAFSKTDNQSKMKRKLIIMDRWDSIKKPSINIEENYDDNDDDGKFNTKSSIPSYFVFQKKNVIFFNYF